MGKSSRNLVKQKLAVESFSNRKAWDRDIGVLKFKMGHFGLFSVSIAKCFVVTNGKIRANMANSEISIINP